MLYKQLLGKKQLIRGKQLLLQKQLLRKNGCEGGKLTQRELRGNGRCERTDFVEITNISIETAAAEETANEV